MEEGGSKGGEEAHIKDGEGEEGTVVADKVRGEEADVGEAE